MKRFLAIILALTMMLTFLSACGSEPTPTPDDGSSQPDYNTQQTVGGESEEMLSVILSDEPDYISPLSGLNQFCATVIFATCEPLIMNTNGELTACLATDWEWVDELHLRVTLRDNVYFHNGEKLKASDVVYSFKMAAQGESASYYTRFDLDNFVVEDDLHVVIALNSVCAYLPEIMYNYLIVSEKAVEDAGGVSAVAVGGDFGTGPYKFTEWKASQYIKLTRNDNYWDDSRENYYKEIQFTFNPEGASRVMSLQSGEVDVIADVPTASLGEAEALPGITIYNSPAASVNCFVMNNAVAPFDDSLVREAVYLLIDPAAVRAVAGEGRGDIVDNFWSPDSPVYAQPVGAAERAVNVERAKELLAEAGYPNGLSITIPSFIPFATINQVIQANLAEGGIEAEIESMDQGAYFQMYFSGTYQCYSAIIDASDYNLALNKLDGRVGPKVAMGGIVASIPELEAYLDTAYNSLDDTERMQAFADIQQYLFDNHNVIGLYSRLIYAASKDTISGLTFVSVGQYPLVHDMGLVA